jgi:hypothetical protein
MIWKRLDTRYYRLVYTILENGEESQDTRGQ